MLHLEIQRHTKTNFRAAAAGAIVWGAFLLSPFRTLAADIPAATSPSAAVLGSAYDSERDLIIGEGCLTGDEVSVGNSSATASFEQVLDKSEVAHELGFSAGGRVQYGAVTATAEARFFRSSKSNDYSVSSVWHSEYRLPTIMYIHAAKRKEKEILNDTKWRETCGNQYVEEISRGASLFFSIRVDFHSKEQKEEFETNFSISGPLYSANAHLKDASQQFSQDTKVTIAALQTGGDVSKLTGLFPQKDSDRAGFVSCTLGNFEKCSEVIQSALHYAADTEAGFPSQLNNHTFPNAILYKTKPYSSAGIYPNFSKELTEEIIESRKNVANEFEKSFDTRSLIELLLAATPPMDRRTLILSEQKKNDDNIVKLVAAGQNCFDNPKSCPQSYKTLALSVIDESALALPPPPTGSMRIMTSTEGVWERNRSVAFMNNPWVYDKAQRVCGKTEDGWGSGPCYGLLDDRTYVITDYFWTSGISASAVLLVEGYGLREATLNFEGQELSKIPLSDPGRAADGRYNDQRAIIVLYSNRKNLGWVDVDLYDRTLDLTKTMPAADGSFYISVRDTFGRRTRFDIAFERWTSKTVKMVVPEGRMTRFAHVMIKHRWWVSTSDGTLVTGTSPWWNEGVADLGRLE